MEHLGIAVTNRQILRLAAPVSLSILIPQLSFFTNTVFVASLGERELGVNGITGVFFMILSMIGYGLASGVQIQLARRAGEEDSHGLTRLFTNGAMLSVLLSLVLMLLTLWIVPFLFGFSLVNERNYLLSVHFIYARVWGLPFLMFTQVINAFFIAVNRSRFIIYGSLVATVVNILFDYLLIFGHGGLPAMGFTGAAVASVIAEIAGCCTMVGAFYAARLYRHYPIGKHLHFDIDLSRRSLTVAAPLIVQFMFSIGGWLVFFFFIEHLGPRDLAASQLIRNFFGIVSIGTWALATACNTMVSNVIGQGRQQEVVHVVKKILRLSLTYAVVLAVILMVFARPFLGVYTSDASLIEYALPSFRLILVSTLLMSLSTVIFNGVVGTGNTMINLTMEMTCVGIYLLYCYIVIYRMRSPLYLCWGSEFVYWTSLLVGATWYLSSGRWKYKDI